MFQAKRTFSNTQTKTVSGAVFTTPENCGEISLLNTGGASGKYRGNVSGSDWVTLPQGVLVTLGYVGISKQPIDVDATGTVIEVTMSI